MLTIEQKKAICEEYKDRSNKVEEIAKRYGIYRHTVVNIAVEMGAEQRRPRKKQDAAVKTCPKCRKTIDIKGAYFCCFCGADIRSNKELLIDRINTSMRKIKFLPEDMRDEIQHLFIDIKTELSKEG
jgi:hypothetical protein